MQRYLWMRPALQKSEAVLLPALPNRFVSDPRFSDRFTHITASEIRSVPFLRKADSRRTLP